MYKRRGQQEYKWYVLGAIERLKITIVMKNLSQLSVFWKSLVYIPETKNS